MKPAMKTAEKLFDEALTHLRKMRYNLAFDLFTEVMEMEPELPEVHYNRGLAASNLMKWDEAVKNFSLALRLTPEEIDCHLHRALALLHLKDWEGALRDLDTVLRLEGDNELANFHRRDLVHFLERPERGPSDVPFLCAEWFDPRLEAFIGVDPEIVPKSERAGLRTYLAEVLDGAVCDHTFRSTEEWALERRKDPLGVARFLYSRGLRCDCEVLGETTPAGADPRPGADPGTAPGSRDGAAEGGVSN